MLDAAAAGRSAELPRLHRDGVLVLADAWDGGTAQTMGGWIASTLP